MRPSFKNKVVEFLTRIGEQINESHSIYLLGGSALILLGNTRDTLDIDYVGSNTNKSEFQKNIEGIGLELELDIEAVPIYDFIPLTDEKRSIFFGTYGNLQVYIFDPYSIAVIKLERGFDTDIEDVIFLFNKGIINLNQIKSIIQETLSLSTSFDINSEQLKTHLEIVQTKLSEK